MVISLDDSIKPLKEGAMSAPAMSRDDFFRSTLSSFPISHHITRIPTCLSSRFLTLGPFAALQRITRPPLRHVFSPQTCLRRRHIMPPAAVSRSLFTYRASTTYPPSLETDSKTLYWATISRILSIVLALMFIPMVAIPLGMTDLIIAMLAGVRFAEHHLLER